MNQQSLSCEGVGLRSVLYEQEVSELTPLHQLESGFQLV